MDIQLFMYTKTYITDMVIYDNYSLQMVKVIIKIIKVEITIAVMVLSINVC